MTTATAAQRPRAARPWSEAIGRSLPSLLPGLAVVALSLVWAVHNGGFDADTWYWGALAALAMLVMVGTLRIGSGRRLPGLVKVALIAFTVYVGWSYVSLAWAQAPGTALQGSNRALLYLIVFALMALIPWRARTAELVLIVFALGVGAIAVVLLLRLDSADSVGGMFSVGRLTAPTGYFNSTAALFTIDALVATALGCRRELPAPLRGLLIGAACASLQLAVIAQSRAWLFTLPLVLILSVAVVPSRLRFVATAALPAVATVISAHRLVAIFSDTSVASLNAGAHSAGHEALLLTGAMLVAATLLAWGEMFIPSSRRAPRSLRVGGSALLILIVIAGGAFGVVRATHNHPINFLKREWNGFSHPTVSRAHGSYFATVGSGRYDFWRVSLDAFASHPIGGLGQDNFEDFYVTRRHTHEEPLWTHSLEMRLLTHTGLVGFVLFAVFLGFAFAAAVRSGRRGPPRIRMLATAAALPAIVWLVHGSVDWFWEMPALTGPALGFLAMAGSLSSLPAQDRASHDAVWAASRLARRGRRVAVAASALLLIVSATMVLTLPYLSVREVSMASDEAVSNPAGAMQDLELAADLNPLNAEAGTRAGLLALSDGNAAVAKQQFDQSISREPGAWLPWLGKGLAESGLGERQQAAQALRHAYAINNQQPPIRVALKRVFSAHPLSYAEAVPLFVIVG